MELSGSKSETVFVDGLGDYELEVVGESHYQNALSAICRGRMKHDHMNEVVARLIHEDSNPFDSEVVRVDVEDALPKPSGCVPLPDAIGRARPPGHPYSVQSNHSLGLETWAIRQRPVRS